MTRRKRRSIGVAIGGVLVGFDQQIFKTLPPAEELVHHARPDGPVATADGDRFTISLPGPLGESESAADGPARGDDDDASDDAGGRNGRA